MLVVVLPDDEAILALQEREQAIYHSAAAEGVFRRTGLISVSTRAAGDLSSAPADPAYLFTRGAAPHRTVLDLAGHRPLAFEGPLSPAVLDWLGLRGTTRHVDKLELRGGGRVWSITRPRVEIGTPPREARLPRMWLNQAIAVQLFDRLKPERVEIEMRLPNGTNAPALFRHKGRWIAAAPLFDLVGENFSFPPLADRYYTKRRPSGMYLLAQVLAASIADFLGEHDGSLCVTCERWPVGFKSAFTVRHDYDREIADGEHAALLELYRRTGIKCATGYLGYQLPAGQIRDLVRAGHEVQLHAYESNAAELKRNVGRLAQLAGTPVRGATFHGGTTSIGFRGDVHFAWLEEAGLAYAENFSFDAYPGPVYRPDPLGIVRRSKLVASPMHFSLDVSTEVGAHRLDYVLERVRENLDAGLLAIAMNHPDLNRKELVRLIEAVPQEAVWRATLGEICDWERVTKYEASVSASGGGVAISFGDALARPVIVSIRRGKAPAERLEIPAGTRTARVDAEGRLHLSAEAPAPRAAQPLPVQHSVLRRRAGRALRAARRRVGGLKLAIREAAARLRPLPVATLVSRLGGRIATDALTGGVRSDASIVLQRADTAAGEQDFLALIADSTPWPARDVVFGSSITRDLHPVVVEAMARIVRDCLPGRMRVLDGRDAARAEIADAGPMAAHLAEWIVKRARAARDGDPSLTPEELSYFIASSGLRVRGIANLIEAMGPPEVETIVDHGAGIALMPWLLASGPKKIAHAVLVEPTGRYFEPMQELWSRPGDLPRWERAATVSEEFRYAGPADVIMFCQTLVRIDPERRAQVLNQAWNALRPGGLLLVNEILTDDEASSDDKVRLVNRADLVATMSWRGPPDLFRADGEWRRAEDPLLPSVKEIGSTGIVAARKPPKDEAVETAAAAGGPPGDVIALDSLAGGNACGWRCQHHLEYWSDWFSTNFGGKSPPIEWNVRDRTAGVSDMPLAMIEVTPTEDAYKALIGDKSRNMLRKAERAGYSVRRFQTADHLDDIYAINRSKAERGGTPMSKDYIDPPKSTDDRPGAYCDVHGNVAVGCFLKDTLVAYCMLAVAGELAVVNRILGHGDHLPNGIMNLLFLGITNVLRRDFPRVRAVNYLVFGKRSSLDVFKRSVGFREHAVLFKAPGLGEDKLEAGRDKAAALYVNTAPFDEAFFRGKGIEGFAPNVPDHRGSGLRAILNHLTLPRGAAVIDISEHGTRTEGAATPDLLVEMFDGPVEILDPRTDATAFLAARYGDKANVRQGQFLELADDRQFDLIVLDLNSTLMARDFEKLIERARQMLKQGGHLASFLVYDSEATYGGTNPLLNPTNRPLQERFANAWFGQTIITPDVARPALWLRGYAVHSIVDKWMGGRGVGWIDLEKL